MCFFKEGTYNNNKDAWLLGISNQYFPTLWVRSQPGNVISCCSSNPIIRHLAQCLENRGSHSQDATLQISQKCLLSALYCQAAFSIIGMSLNTWVSWLQWGEHFLNFRKSQSIKSLSFSVNLPPSLLPSPLPFHFCPTISSLYFVYLFQKRERAGEGQRERLPSRLCTIRAEPDAGLEPMNREMVTWVKIKSQTLNRLSRPDTLVP